MAASDPVVDRILAALNEPQRDAATWEGPSLLILAGAGSGKTRTLTCRIAYGVATGLVRPDQVLAVTFSNRAARELRGRISQLLEGGGARDGFAPATGSGWHGGFRSSFLGITFHAFGLGVLRNAVAAGDPSVDLRSGFSIYDQDDQRALVRRVLQDLQLPCDAASARGYVGAIAGLKSDGLDPTSPRAVERAGRRLPSYLGVARRYEAGLRRSNAVDFGDLLLRPMALLRDDPSWRDRLRHRFRWVLIDEFQDTNDVQMALVKLLVGPATSLSVVGDDDQSIYRWRGARVANILGFPQAFDETHVVRLEQNYRSTGHILGAANAVIARNRRRHAKRLWTAAGEGRPVRVLGASTDREEARWVAERIEATLTRAPAEEPPPEKGGGEEIPVAVFYRTHAQSRLLEESLRMSGVGYRIYGGLRFWDRKEIKDAIAYVRLALNPADDEAFLRAVNEPPRRIGKATLTQVRALASDTGRPLLAAARDLAARGGRGASARLRPFAALMDDLDRSLAGAAAHDAVERVVEATGLKAALERDPTPENSARLENLGQLVNAAHDFVAESEDPSLQAFLERLALRAGSDDLEADLQPSVALMTLHNAKGLEFDHVFVTGVEKGLIPHFASQEEEAVEEERRLLYVGMTRARKTLTLSYAAQRQRFGQESFVYPSPFLRDLPPRHLEPGPGVSAARPPAVGSRRPRGAVAPRRAEEHWVDRHFSDPLPDLDGAGSEAAGGHVGRRVRHRVFGAGRIRRVIGRPGPDASVEVSFEDGRTRKIIARFLDPLG